MTVVAVVEILTDDQGSSTDFAEALETTASYYLTVPGLVRKHYLWGADGVRGGVYVWRTHADAEAFFGDEWRTRIRQRYGAEPVVRMFENPVTVECGGVTFTPSRPCNGGEGRGEGGRGQRSRHAAPAAHSIVAAERRESPSPRPSPPRCGGEGEQGPQSCS